MKIDACFLSLVTTRFADYVARFYSGDEVHDSSLRIKEVHTAHVVEESRGLAESISLDDVEKGAAELAALLHDIGRFEQYERHHTYRDSDSEDHAVLGVRVIRETGMIDECDADDRELIAAVVGNHNRASLPESGDGRLLMHLKILRDADKIDILRVVTGHYRGEETNGAIDIGLPDTSGISGAIVRSISRGEPALVSDMRTLNDFKLLQMSWVFDINFPHSFRQLRERRYMDMLFDSLPLCEDVSRSCDAVMRHLEMRSSP